MGQKNKKKTHIYFNTNYRTEMKLVPINMDYCLLQFDALIFFLGVRLHGVTLTNFDFFFQYKPLSLTTKSQSSPLRLPEYKFSQYF